MTAVMASSAGFLVTISLPCTTLRPGSERAATRAGMWIASRTRARSLCRKANAKLFFRVANIHYIRQASKSGLQDRPWMLRRIASRQAEGMTIWHRVPTVAKRQRGIQPARKVGTTKTVNALSRRSDPKSVSYFRRFSDTVMMS